MIKNKGGRPSKYKGLDDKLVRKLIEAFKDDFTVEEACLYAGISKSTFYDWKAKNTEFSNEIDQSQMFLIFEAKKKLKKALLKSDSFEVALKFLERKQPQTYSIKRQEIKPPATTETTLTLEDIQAFKDLGIHDTRLDKIESDLISI